MSKKQIFVMSGSLRGVEGGFEDKDYLLNVFRQRQKTLKENGLELKLLVPDRRFWKDLNSFGATLDKEMPESVLELSDKYCKDANRYLQSLSWPRDMYQVFGKDIYSYRIDKRTLGQLFDRKDLCTYNSALGEGGLNVRLDNVVLFSNILSNETFKQDIGRVKSSGFYGYFLPTFLRPEDAKNSHEEVLAARMKENAHIDTEIGLAKTTDGNHLLLVTPEYYKTFKEAVILLRKDLDAKIYIPEGERMAVNLVNLPNGKVILPNKYQSTIDFLKENMGKENVIEFETIKGEINCYGGLRCRTNIIEG